MLNQIKAQQFYTNLGLYHSIVRNPTEKSRIQGLFKTFERFSITFADQLNFQGHFKKAL